MSDDDLRTFCNMVHAVDWNWDVHDFASHAGLPLDEAEEQFPRIRELDSVLRGLSSQALRAIAGASDAPASTPPAAPGPQLVVPPGVRAFRTEFIVRIDEESLPAIDDDEDVIDAATPVRSIADVALNDVIEFLTAALILDVNTDDVDNDVGYTSAEIILDELTELTPDELREYYGRPPDPDDDASAG